MEIMELTEVKIQNKFQLFYYFGKDRNQDSKLMSIVCRLYITTF